MPMDTLRLILLVTGLAIVAFIYLRARRQQGKRLDILRHFDNTFLTSFKSKPDVAAPVHPQRDASLAEDDLDVFDNMVAVREDTAEVSHDDMSMSTDELTMDAGEPLVLMLTIVAREGKLSGPILSDALHNTGFRFGDMMAFNLFAKAGQTHGHAICTAVNVLEPGSFPDAQLEGIDVPGIILIMQLPGPLEPRTAFDKVLEVAEQLAEELDAELCDEQRNRLTKQGISHMKDKVEAYRFKQKMAQIKRRS